MKDRAANLMFGLALAAFAALIPLAWLQYRWIGQVSQANEERLRGHLHASMAGFCQDFMQQLVRASLDEDTPVTRTYLVQRHPDGALRLSQGAEVDWPPELAKVREQLTAGNIESPLVDGSAPILVFPRGRGGPPPGGPPPGMPMGMGMGMGIMRHRGMMEHVPPGAMAWRVSLLDEKAIRGTLLPELTERWFAREPDAAYHVRVVSNGRKIYESAPFAEADAAIPLPGAGSPWLLEVRYRDEPLRAFVDHARRRNLAVGFGILLVLAASLAVLFVAMQRAYELSRLQMEFVAGVSHELRTPLSVICAAGDNLAEAKVATPEQVRRYGSVIRGEGRRLTQMVEQVMANAGFLSGRIQMHPGSLEVEPLARKALDACAVQMKERNLSVELDLDPALPPVRGDERMLVQALRNLIDNALKHGGDAQGPIVSAHREDRMVRFSVTDHGPGVPREELGKIFEPFFRGKRAREAQREGSGLGLALVARIAGAHGGRVLAENVPGGGARFSLTVPVW